MFVKDLVSIITPVYNAENTLVQCIESVLAQTYTNFELILINDCSSDDSEMIIHRYLENNPRLIYLKNSNNLGPAGSRNIGLDTAKGQYIAFLDSDDYWDESKLFKQINYLKSSNSFMVCSEYIRFKEKIYRKRINITRSIIDYSSLLYTNNIYTSTVVVDREVTGLFRMPINYYDDFVCWLNLTRKFGVCGVINEPLMFYRVNSISVSSNKLKSAKKVYYVYRDVLQMDIFRRCWYFFWYLFNGVRKHFLT